MHKNKNSEQRNIEIKTKIIQHRCVPITDKNKNN